MKKTITNVSLIFLICLIAFGCCLILSSNMVKADTMTDIQLLNKCKLYTDKLELYEDNSKNILDYETYLDNRFQIANKKNDNNQVSDEWIFQIIPKELFDQKKTDFLYIGKNYGFYFNYENANSDYFIYFIKHLINQETSGQYVSKLQPFYYEKYHYNVDTQKVALNYISENKSKTKYYQKYSSVKNVYLKDINFTGALYNENNLNLGESGYTPSEDNGAFFYGSKYKFKGESIQSGKTDFALAVLKIGFGYLPLGNILSLGDAMNVVDFANEFVGLDKSMKADFRQTISNEQIDLYLQITHNDAIKQIQEYGNLLKHMGTIFETQNNKDAALIGIKNNCYAENTFYIKYSNDFEKWNSRFVGNISMKIVEEDSTFLGSKITEIANVETQAPYNYYLDNDQATTVLENENTSVYNLWGGKHDIKFVAPTSDIYNFKILSDFDCEIINSKNHSVNINQINIFLEQGEEIIFSISQNEKLKSNLIIEFIIEFMPDQISCGDNKEFVLGAGQTKVFSYNAKSSTNMGFDFNVTSEEKICLNFSFNDRRHIYIIDYMGNNIVGSKFADKKGGTYYIHIINISNNDNSISLSISELDSAKLSKENESTIINEKTYIFNNSFTMTYKLILQNDLPSYLNIYDENLNTINWISDPNVKEVVFTAEKDKNYYIQFKSSHNLPVSFSFKIETYLVKTYLGNNSLSKQTKDLMVSFDTNAVDTNYYFNSTNNNIEIYDSSMNRLMAESGKYFLEKNKNFYIYISGDDNKLVLDISIGCTLEKEGQFNYETIFIKFIPQKSGLYEVTSSGVIEKQWFDNNLKINGDFLISGITYYLNIKGNKDDNYNVTFEIKSNPITINKTANIFPGNYYIVVEEARNYDIRTYCASGVNSWLNISNSNHEIIGEQLVTDELSSTVSLDAGIYYIELFANKNSIISIKII